MKKENKVSRRAFLSVGAVVATGVAAAGLNSIDSNELVHPKGIEENLQASSKKEKTTTILWQLDAQTRSQMNSYVLQTPNNSIIVIDGGCKGDAPYLKGFLAALGNHVDMWIITHPHLDHICALTEILKKPDGLTIDKIWGSFPTVEWISKYEKKHDKDIVEFQEVMSQANKRFRQVQLGEKFEVDNVKMEVLGVINPEITHNAMNNSSMVFKMNLPQTSLLFLGDLGHEGGEKLLGGEFASKLPSDYVQMSHHGQEGVSEAVYQAINPSICLWPTPDWLWDNNKGEGKNSGPWKTLEVREWMNKLNVEKHYIMKDGLHKIELY
jgi:beta-lactamase superfamily II metal-dependent hydrolase